VAWDHGGYETVQLIFDRNMSHVLATLKPKTSTLKPKTRAAWDHGGYETVQLIFDRNTLLLYYARA